MLCLKIGFNVGYNELGSNTSTIPVRVHLYTQLDIWVISDSKVVTKIYA